MSSNRLNYDKCAKAADNEGNKTILEHTMDVNMYKNTKMNNNESVCPSSYRVATTSRNHNSKNHGDLVDTESKLRRLDKKLSKCGN